MDYFGLPRGERLVWPGQREAALSNSKKSDRELGVVLDFSEEGFDGADFRRRCHGISKTSEKRRRIEMSATMVASRTKAVRPVVSSILDILLTKIRESKTNPRRFFDEAKLAELADFAPRNKIRVMWSNPLCAVWTRALGRVPGDYYPKAFSGLITTQRWDKLPQRIRFVRAFG
jgi:hypothetical protein